jgi:uncharacterized membrane protein
MKLTNSVFQVKRIKDSNQSIFLLTLFLWISTIISQLGSLTYSTSKSGQGFQSVILQSIIYLSLVTIPLSAIGIWLGRQIGLGAPLLSAIARKQPGTLKIFLRDAKWSVLPGLFLGGAMVIFRILANSYLPQELPSFGHRGILGGFLVSAGAAIGEEVWFRLGLLTIILWIVNRISGHNSLRSSVAWTTIIVVAILFGVSHLPQLSSYGAASAFAVWGTILGNCVVGILFGWCYWRLGLIAAIMAHFSVDIVIHALPSLFY